MTTLVAARESKFGLRRTLDAELDRWCQRVSKCLSLQSHSVSISRCAPTEGLGMERTKVEFMKVITVASVVSTKAVHRFVWKTMQVK